MTEEDKNKLQRYMNSIRVAVENNLQLNRKPVEYAGRARNRGISAFLKSNVGEAEDMIVDSICATFLARKETF